jgi:dipeptidyl aminopeptidase/acylaminoacyl peptidase
MSLTRQTLNRLNRLHSKELTPFVMLFLFCTTATATFAQKKLAPLPIDAGMAAKTLAPFVPIDLSPDGGLLAYTLKDPERRRKEESFTDPAKTGTPQRLIYCDIWINDIKTGTARNLTQGKGSSWGPVWSPDGKWLAFFSDRLGTQTVWVWERSSGRIRQLSNLTVRVLESKVVRWTPDSKYLVVPFLPEGVTLPHGANMLDLPSPAKLRGDQKDPTVTVFSGVSREKVDPDAERLRLAGYLRHYPVDLAVVDVSNGRTRRLARSINLQSWWVSPDGTHVALMTIKGFDSPKTLRPLWDLSVISLADGAQKTLVANYKANNATPAAWSPDGKSIAYITTAPTTECWIVDLGGNMRHVTPGEHPPFNANPSRGPVWDATGRYIYLLSSTSLWRTAAAEGNLESLVTIPQRNLVDIVSPQAGTVWEPKENVLILMTRDPDTKREGIYQVDIKSRDYSPLLEDNVSFGFVTSSKIAVSRDNSRIVYCSQKTHLSEDVWTIDKDLATPQRITQISPVFDRYVMGESRMIEWLSADGVKVRGALLLPAGYQEGRRYPLIVWQYPGSPWSNYGNLFGFNLLGGAVENWQFFATRGYAILMPDIPAKPGTFMEDIPKAVMPGLDKVIELGIADPERLGVMGISNGGYGVLSLIVQTTRFKAAISNAGPANLISQYTQMGADGNSPYMVEMLQRTGGSLWEKRESFIKNSPLFFFDRIQTPLLICQGTADRQVTTPRGDEIFVTLRFLGKEVEYARYEGEGHGFIEWRYPNQVDYLNRALAWFDKYLKAPAKSEGSKN